MKRRVGNTAYGHQPILTFGEPLTIFTHVGGAPIVSDRTFLLDIGGAELNTAVALARLDADVVYAAAVGNDAFGEFILRELRAEGVDIRFVQTLANAPTGTLFKIQEGMSGNPAVYYYRALSPLGTGGWSDDTVLQALGEGSFGWVHTTGITWMLHEKTRNVADGLVHKAHAEGIPVSFDINVRNKLAPINKWRDLMHEVAPFATWLFIGDSEARVLFQTEQPEEVLAHLRQDGFAGVGLLLKRGERGAVLVTDAGTVEAPIFPVPRVVDTVGAGDGFNAGWISAQCRGLDYAEGLKLAAIVGACAVTSRGDASGYPTWSQVQNYLAGIEEVTR